MVYAVIKSTYNPIARFMKQQERMSCFKLSMFIAGWYSHMCTPKITSVLSSTHGFLLLLIYTFLKLGFTKKHKANLIVLNMNEIVH